MAAIAIAAMAIDKGGAIQRIYQTTGGIGGLPDEAWVRSGLTAKIP